MPALPTYAIDRRQHASLYCSPVKQVSFALCCVTGAKKAVGLLHAYWLHIVSEAFLIAAYSLIALYSLRLCELFEVRSGSES